jgi:hypothetical protein
MPVDIDTSATFEDLILRLAERVGLADQSGTVAAIPTDADNLAKIKRCVNEGYARFLRAYKYWSFLEQDVQITLSSAGTGGHCIESDPGRYALPGYVAGSPKGPWTYVDERTARAHIQNIAPSLIDGYRQGDGGSSGVPCYAACRPRATGAPKGGAPLGWEALFWPLPDSNYVIKATFRIKQHKLVENHDRHIAGSEHDDSLHAFCWLAWQEDDAEDPHIAERAKAAAMERLAESVELDKQNHPDSVGMNDGIPHSGTVRLPRVYSHNGVPIVYPD